VAAACRRSIVSLGEEGRVAIALCGSGGLYVEAGDGHDKVFVWKAEVVNLLASRESEI
jgi:hypothetical protein